MWAKKKVEKKRWLIVPLLLCCQLTFCQQRIHERWKPSAPLAQIPLCTHKRRNSSKITKKQELFPRPCDPKSFPNERGKKTILLEEVWRTLLHLLIRAFLRKSLWWTARVCIFVYKCVHSHLCVCWGELRGGGAGERRREGGRRLIRNGCLCFLCLCLVLEMKASGGGGVGAGASIFIRVPPCAVKGPLCPYYGRVQSAQLSQSPLKNSGAVKTGMVPISKQTYALKKSWWKCILMS